MLNRKLCQFKCSFLALDPRACALQRREVITPNSSKLNGVKLLFSAWLFIKQCQSCGKNHPASPRASHYFVVQSARQSRTARGRSSYRRESTYSHMQVNLRVYSELFSALLNIFASTPSRNRTYNCPLGGGCYIHLTMRAKSGLCSISRRFLFYPVITDIFSKHRLYLISPKEGLSRCGRSGHRQQSGNRLVF